MKKTVKIIALCLSLAALTVLFTGCDYLDEMKANHAIISEDMKTIAFRGDTYRLLPEYTSFYLSDGYWYDYDVHVTNEDVPVLVKDMFCYSATYYQNSDIFYVYTATEPNLYYCNEKDYDKYVKAIEENNLDRVGFSYETYGDNGYWFYQLDVASEEVSKEILGYIKNPEKMENSIYSIIKDNSYCLQSTLYSCDSEGILAEPLDGYDIYKFNTKAYLVNYLTEEAVELSENASDALEDKYFFGNYVYGEETDDGSIAIIGGADGRTNIFVNEEVYELDI